MIYFVDGLLWVIALGLGLVETHKARHPAMDGGAVALEGSVY